jgi:hypothetical protein
MSEQPREIRIIEDRWPTVRHVVESIAIIAAGLWAANVFIYQERIKPMLEPPSLQPTVTFEPGKTIGGTRVAQLHIVLANTGSVDTDVYADAASVFGDRFAPAAPAPKPSYGPGSVLLDRMVQTTPKELIFSEATLRTAAGGIGHIILRPDQRVDFVLPIAVKNGRFDELHATYSIIYGRYQQGRYNFARIAIERDKNGSVLLDEKPNKPGDNGFEDDAVVQVTL